MTKDQRKSPEKRRKRLLTAILLTVMVAAGLLIWQRPAVTLLLQPTPTGAVSAYQSTTVRRGDLSLTVSGTGTLAAAETLDLGFSSGGTVAAINVQVGDMVSQGQVLAQLDGLDQLNLAIANQQLAVLTSQKAVDDLQKNALLKLSQAQAAQAKAQEAVESARANLRQKGVERCTTSQVHDYYFKYTAAQKRVDEWEGYLTDANTGYGHDYILEKLAPMRKERDLAAFSLQYCQGYTEAEILDGQAAYQLAEANLKQASKVKQALQASAGIDPTELAIAQATLKNAQLQLSKARSDLQGADLIAPFNGTVTAVNGSAGQPSGDGALVSVANLEQPIVQVNFDETDLGNIVLDRTAGCPTQVSFSSLPGQTFSGTFSQMAPELVSVRGVSMVSGWVTLNETKTKDRKTLPLGLTASVEITCAQSKNALQAPAQAIYERAVQPPYVYILNAQSQPEKRDVSIGIRTTAFVEILSGLNAGDRVITSTVKE